MDFKEWMIKEMASFSLNQNEPLSVYIGDGPSGPFHTESFNVTGIDMRFEDYSIEGQKPPQGNWSAPLANNSFINYNSAKPHQTTVGPQAFYPLIRQDWARFAELYSGNVVLKPAQYDRGAQGIVQHKPNTIPINQPNQNPSRLQSA